MYELLTPCGLEKAAKTRTELKEHVNEEQSFSALKKFSPIRANQTTTHQFRLHRYCWPGPISNKDSYV